MTINSVLNTGVQGVQRGIEGAERAASEIVRAGTVDGAAGSNSNDVVESLVDLRLYERSVEASAQVVRTADEVLGTLLDTLA
ncbi:MAG: flagellar biosynthesis protein FlgE [Oleiphilus sp.]|nr:MAG: flagellar biosynthesis protein FlgE [Oleiphilus sp.]